MDIDSRAHRLASLSSEAFAALSAQNPVILLPLGSHEDHGPHLPMGDYALADLLAGQIAAASSAAGTLCLAAPSLPFGVADFFGASAGGFALSAGTFSAVLVELLESLLRHGFNRVVILNGHGGNVPVIHQVTLAIRRSHNIVIPSFYLWKIARKLMEDRLGPGYAARFGHGAEPLLSLSLALRPEETALAPASAPSAATMLGLKVSGFGTLDFKGVEIDAPAEFTDVPRTSIAAASPLASAELGADVAAALVAAAADFVRHVGG